MMDALERKQNMDKEMAEQLKTLREARKTLPRGTLENYAAQVNAKVQSYEEENKLTNLTDAEIREAT